MKYRELGKTGLKVSEIGLGAEWLERHNGEEIKEVILHCESVGISILDCWMSEPNVRSNIDAVIQGCRDRWIIQGHLGSTWQNGRYMRTRDLDEAQVAFADLLERLDADYIDLGMIHFVDEKAEFKQITEGEFYAYAKELKEKGIVHHIGMGTHDPAVAKLAAGCGKIEMTLLNINPAFDMFPASENIDDYFKETYNEHLGGTAPERTELYRICGQNNIGITVVKGYVGGRLFSVEASPFRVALTPTQCLHYALTRPVVVSVLVEYDTPEHVDAAVAYETASEEEKDYITTLPQAPAYTYYGQCTYCDHYTPCPVGIDTAMVNKLYDLALMQDTVPATIKTHYDSLSSNGSDCIGCRGCEERCPFGVPVSEHMVRAGELFQQI